MKFAIRPSQFAEDLDKSKFADPAAYVLETARQKALDVERSMRQEGVSIYNSTTQLLVAHRCADAVRSDYRRRFDCRAARPYIREA